MLIIDDHPLLRQGMATLIGSQPDFEICGEAEHARGGLQAMRETSPHIALVDITLPGTDGLELIKLMLAEQPKLRILVVSMHDESLYALRSLRAGAKGYLMKAEAIEQVVAAAAQDRGGRHLHHPALQRAAGLPRHPVARGRLRLAGGPPFPTVNSKCCACWARGWAPATSPRRCT